MFRQDMLNKIETIILETKGHLTSSLKQASEKVKQEEHDLIATKNKI